MRDSTELLNTAEIPLFLLDRAMEYWQKGDILGVLYTMSNTRCLGFVFDNILPLKMIGKYEEALLHAYCDTRGNYLHWSLRTLSYMFNEAHPQRLREAGDLIPEQETFTLYRGVNGVGRLRRVNSFSWTSSPNVAAWFARRFDRHDPAVFTVTVQNGNIMAYLDKKGRNECEYLVKLPLPAKPKRLKEMPEPIFHPKEV
jgi:hypothetical protein